MRTATQTVAAWLGIVAGFAGLEHGYFEIQQGNIQPASIMFSSMGAPCIPDKIWNACEPAMSVLPSFLLTGIVTIILGLAIIVWSATFIQHEHGGLILIVLSIVFLLFGGGFFPPLIGIIGGAAGTQINKPMSGKPGGVTRLFGRLRILPLVILVIYLVGQFPIGYFFNDWLMSVMGYGLLLILILLPLSVYSAYAHDAIQGAHL
jgi:hypothetical protein